MYLVKRFGQRWPQRLSKVSKRRLKDDTDVLGTAHVCHSLFVRVNLEVYQGSSVTIQSNLSYNRLG